jgi:hypothetical protein
MLAGSKCFPPCPRKRTQSQGIGICRDGPLSAIYVPANRPLLEHLVGAGEHGVRHRKAKCFGGLEIDHELVLGRLLDRNVARLRTAQNLANEFGLGP